MDYQKIYNNLIYRAKNRLLEGYSENHHIIPECMGGQSTFENMVRLTAEEHYVAHQLLVKIYPKNGKLLDAVQMMTVSGIGQERSQNKMYGWLKKKHAEYKREARLNKSFEDIFGKEKSLVVRKKISDALKGKKRSSEHSLNISRAKKGKPSSKKGKPGLSGELNPNYGKKRPGVGGVKKGTIPWNKGIKNFKEVARKRKLCQ